MVIETAVLCLAMNVFHEARGEFIPGQYAVAHVTMNRAGWDQDKVCSVVFKPKQFSWANTSQRVGNGWKLPKYLITAVRNEPDAWARAWRIAEWTLAGKMPDITGGARFYHADYVQPGWSRSAKLRRTRSFGTHIFYRHANK